MTPILFTAPRQSGSRYPRDWIYFETWFGIPHGRIFSTSMCVCVFSLIFQILPKHNALNIPTAAVRRRFQILRRGCGRERKASLQNCAFLCLQFNGLKGVTFSLTMFWDQSNRWRLMNWGWSMPEWSAWILCRQCRFWIGRSLSFGRSNMIFNCRQRQARMHPKWDCSKRCFKILAIFLGTRRQLELSGELISACLTVAGMTSQLAFVAATRQTKTKQWVEWEMFGTFDFMSKTGFLRRFPPKSTRIQSTSFWESDNSNQIHFNSGSLEHPETPLATAWDLAGGEMGWVCRVKGHFDFWIVFFITFYKQFINNGSNIIKPWAKAHCICFFLMVLSYLNPKWLEVSPAGGLHHGVLRGFHCAMPRSLVGHGPAHEVKPLQGGCLEAWRFRNTTLVTLDLFFVQLFFWYLTFGDDVNWRKIVVFVFHRSNSNTSGPREVVSRASRASSKSTF